jgi:hypothetical protein
MSTNYKELKKQNYYLFNNNQQQQQQLAGMNPNVSNQLNVSSDMVKSPNKSNSGNTSLNNLNQENEDLEEDMRKAKESADMLRSVVLPLETEINTLRSRSNTSDKRIQELEKIVEEVKYTQKSKFIKYNIKIQYSLFTEKQRAHANQRRREENC